MPDQLKENGSVVDVKTETDANPKSSDQENENNSGASKTEDKNEDSELLAQRGREAITRAEGLMPGLMECRRRHGLVQPLYGARIAGCSYFDAKTAVLIETLIALGAEVQWTNSELVYSEEEENAVAAALKHAGVSVYLWDGLNNSVQSAWKTVKFPFEMKASVVLDDYGLLAKTIISYIYYPAHELCFAKQELSLIALSKLATVVNTSKTNLRIFNAYELLAKAKLASYYGWEGSLVQYIKEVIDPMLAPENVCVILGYNAKGKSCARALRGAGVNVLIADPVTIDALEAKMDSFELVTLQQACKRAKVFVFATDSLGPILDHIGKMKDYSLICNIGSSDKDIDWLKKNAQKEESSEVYLTRYKLKNGNYVECLDLKCLDRVGNRCSNAVSYSYTLWVLVAIHGWSKQGQLSAGSYSLPEHLEEEAARFHL